MKTRRQIHSSCTLPTEHFFACRSPAPHIPQTLCSHTPPSNPPFEFICAYNRPQLLNLSPLGAPCVLPPACRAVVGCACLLYPSFHKPPKPPPYSLFFVLRACRSSQPDRQNDLFAPQFEVQYCIVASHSMLASLSQFVPPITLASQQVCHRSRLASPTHGISTFALKPQCILLPSFLVCSPASI